MNPKIGKNPHPRTFNQHCFFAKFADNDKLFNELEKGIHSTDFGILT